MDKASKRQKANMNYLEAKTVLLKSQPEISWRLIGLEAAILVGVAGILVHLFA